jgi:hypothetical protein
VEVSHMASIVEFFWRLLRSQDMGYGVRRLFSITLTPPCVDPRVAVPSVKGFCNS